MFVIVHVFDVKGRIMRLSKARFGIRYGEKVGGFTADGVGSAEVLWIPACAGMTVGFTAEDAESAEVCGFGPSKALAEAGLSPSPQPSPKNGRGGM